MPSYPNYGARGIRVCDRWKRFNLFLADVGPRPSRAYSLDRADVNGNYEPGNVRWATRSEQARNTRKNVTISAAGKSMILADWAAETGIPEYVLRRRLARGWTHERAVSDPAPTRKQAMRNRPSNRMVTHEGRTMCVSDWAAEVGTSHQTIRQRLLAGWSVERALTEPVRKQA